MVSGKLNVNDGHWGMDRRHKDEWIESLEGRRICYGSQHLVCSLSLKEIKVWILAFQHLS